MATDNTQPIPQEEGKPSKAVQEAAELLDSLLQVNPLPDAPEVLKGQEHEGVYALSSEAAKTLNCVAIIRNGSILPMVSLEDVSEPKTPGEKMHLFALTARTIMDGLMDALCFWEARRRMEGDERNNEGGTCV